MLVIVIMVIRDSDSGGGGGGGSGGGGDGRKVKQHTLNIFGEIDRDFMYAECGMQEQITIPI